jgi:ribosomal 50S subunit-recycling heat shock protein
MLAGGCMPKFECDRKNEELDWFLYREKIISNREEAIKAIESGGITINGKVVKKKEYKPKKGDSFIVSNGGRTLFFTVSL